MNRRDRPGRSLRAWMLLLAIASAMPLVLTLGYAIHLQADQQEEAQFILVRERAIGAAAILDQQLKLINSLLEEQAGSREVSQADVPEMYQDANRMLATQRAFTVFEMSDSRGSLVYRAARDPSQAMPPGKAWSCAARQPNGEAASSLSTVPTGLRGDEGWNARATLRLASGPLAGCRLAASASLRGFGEALRAREWPLAWVAAVVDRDFRIIARSTLAEQYVGLGATEPLRRAIREGGNRAFDGTARDGTRVLAYTVPVPGGNGWHIAVGVAERVVRNELRSSTWRFIGLSLAALAFAGGVALLLAARISQVIRSLGGALDPMTMAGTGFVKIKEAHAVGELLANSRASLDVAAQAQQRLIRTLEAENARRVLTERTLKSVQAKLMAVQETERRIVARELHDELGQELALLQIMLKSIRTRGTADNRMLHDCEAGVLRMSDHVRTLALALRPAMLDDLGLAAALSALTRPGNPPHQPQIRVEMPKPSRRFPADVETALYRVAQAATTNALRHANARTIVVALTFDAARVSIEVSDDGGGFDPEGDAALAGEHLGLVIMRERMAAVGGSLTISSGPGGTRVVASAPLSPTEAFDE
ncbi:MAG: ATP-binding protein [Pseudomonadota bacterium]